jgi:hypothetical protein
VAVVGLRDRALHPREAIGVLDGYQSDEGPDGAAGDAVPVPDSPPAPARSAWKLLGVTVCSTNQLSRASHLCGLTSPRRSTLRTTLMTYSRFVSQCKVRLTGRGVFISETQPPVERLAKMATRLPYVPLGASLSGFSPPARLTQLVAPSRLWKAVLNARADVAQERRQTQPDPRARIALVDALQSYVNSLAQRNHPVPYALRDELRLQRLSCGSSP